jgi:hypothetical protein
MTFSIHIFLQSCIRCQFAQGQTSAEGWCRKICGRGAKRIQILGMGCLTPRQGLRWRCPTYPETGRYLHALLTGKDGRRLYVSDLCWVIGRSLKGRVNSSPTSGFFLLSHGHPARLQSASWIYAEGSQLYLRNRRSTSKYAVQRQNTLCTRAKYCVDISGFKLFPTMCD